MRCGTCLTLGSEAASHLPIVGPTLGINNLPQEMGEIVFLIPYTIFWVKASENFVSRALQL